MSVFPLGAHVDPDGARFAVASSSAEAVEVCLVDGEPGGLTERRVALTERTFGVWHGHVPGITAGQRYGYRVHGPYRPWEGSRANPAKILVDPYARQITGTVTDLEAARGWTIDPMTGPPSTVDSLGHVPLSVLTAAPSPMIRPAPDLPLSLIPISRFCLIQSLAEPCCGTMPPYSVQLRTIAGRSGMPAEGFCRSSSCHCVWCTAP